MKQFSDVIQQGWTLAHRNSVARTLDYFTAIENADRPYFVLVNFSSAVKLTGEPFDGALEIAFYDHMPSDGPQPTPPPHGSTQDQPFGQKLGVGRKMLVFVDTGEKLVLGPSPAKPSEFRYQGTCDIFPRP